jgi:hypothetical protein
MILDFVLDEACHECDESCATTLQGGQVACRVTGRLLAEAPALPQAAMRKPHREDRSRCKDMFCSEMQTVLSRLLRSPARKSAQDARRAKAEAGS